MGLAPPEELELDEDELLELDEEDDEEDDELEEELELLELELDEELDEELELLEELDELDELELPEGTEHSLVPPATRVPAPKVASEQTKLPERTL